jgi:hypothetical protein
VGGDSCVPAFVGYESPVAYELLELVEDYFIVIPEMFKFLRHSAVIEETGTVSVRVLMGD